MGSLTKTVILVDPETQAPTVFAPGDDLPGWARDRINNPKVWESDDSPADADADEPEDETDSEDDDLVDPENDSDDEPEVEQPPRSGRGSGIKAWQEYADAVGVEYAEDDDRDAIIAAVDAAA